MLNTLNRGFVVGATPVTFLVSPDTHFTSSGGTPDIAKNARGILDMNQLQGQPYPGTSTWGGAVHNISGVVVPGDLVDDGCNMQPKTGDPGCAAQWGNYTSYFHVTGASSADDSDTVACIYPTFEGVGNHDGGNSTDKASGLVRRGVISRNEQRAATPGNAGAQDYAMSPNHLHYSWSWSGVHFVMLGVYPGTAGDCASGTGVPGNGCAKGSAPWGWHSPEHSLDFLIADLAKLDKATPTVLFMHYGMQGFGSPGTVPWAGYSPDFWWSTREAMAFAEAIAAHNIVAIVHGHTHACVFYQWDLTKVTGRVYDVFNAPALQKGGKNDPLSTPSQYLAFELDVEQGRFRAFQRVGAAWGKIALEKNLSHSAPPEWATPTGIASAREEEGVGVARQNAKVGTIVLRAEDTVNVVPPHHVV